MKSIEKLIDNEDLKIKKFRPVNDDYDTRYIDILYFKSEIICFFNYDSDEKMYSFMSKELYLEFKNYFLSTLLKEHEEEIIFIDESICNNDTCDLFHHRNINFDYDKKKKRFICSFNEPYLSRSETKGIISDKDIKFYLNRSPNTRVYPVCSEDYLDVLSFVKNVDNYRRKYNSMEVFFTKDSFCDKNAPIPIIKDETPLTDFDLI